MKRIIITMAVIFGCINVCFARTNLVATLSHGGQLSQFYGTNALTAAYNAANDGDIITLSSGEFSFSSGKFEKGITLRGTGIETSHSTSDLAKPYLTFITSSLSFYSKDSNCVTSVEGITFKSYVKIYNTSSDKGQGTIKFIKNRFDASVSFESDFTETPPNSPVVRFYNNYLSSSVTILQYSKPDYKFYNCFINTWVDNYVHEENSSAFLNCFFSYYGTTQYSANRPFQNSSYLNFYNCIFCNLRTTVESFTSNYGGTLASTASCINCLSINKNSSDRLFSDIYYSNNNRYSSNISDVFQTYSGGNTWHETFELTESAKKSYIGSDSTEIGLQGGIYPYNVTVQYPIITTLSSDVQTTKEGMLNVNIGVDEK